jgi:hypothetical protein
MFTMIGKIGTNELISWESESRDFTGTDAPLAVNDITVFESPNPQLFSSPNYFFGSLGGTTISAAGAITITSILSQGISVASNVITVSEHGWYKILVNGNWTSSLTTNPTIIEIQLLWNSVEEARGSGTRFSTSSGLQTPVTISALIEMEAGDTLRLTHPNTGTVTTQTNQSRICVHKIG